MSVAKFLKRDPFLLCPRVILGYHCNNLVRKKILSMKALVVASTGRDRNIDRAAFEGNHRSSSRFCDQLQIDLWILNFELSSHWTEPWVSRIALGSKTKFYVRQHGIVGEFLFHQFHLLKNRGCRNLKTLADWGQKHAPTRSIEQCFIHSTDRKSVV